MSIPINESVSALETAKTDIGTAITAKGGTVNSGDGFSDFAADIATIPIIEAKKEVNFYDFDGTLVKGYTIAEAQALSALPTPPDHSADTTPLTFQEWNYTLAQVNATNLPLDVGATYITADGKSHFHLTFTAASDYSPSIYYNKSDTSTLSIRIVRLSDGAVMWSTTDTSSGNRTKTPSGISAEGDYDLQFWISSGSGTYGFGNGTSSASILGAVTKYKQILTKAFIGSNVPSITTFSFYNLYSLRLFSIPRGVTAVEASAFRANGSLEALVLPIGVTNIAEYTTNWCYALRLLSIPYGVTNIGASAIVNCLSLVSLVIPSSVTGIADSAFSSSTSTIKYILSPISPPTLPSANPFTGISSICKIYTLPSSLSAYRAATYWSTYAANIDDY